MESLVYHFCLVVNVVSKLQGRYLELDELCALPVVCELSVSIAVPLIDIKNVL